MASNECHISVVLSTYNRSADLLRALPMTLAQRDAPPYEVIVVDNNSTDGTREIVARYEAVSPRLRYVFEPNQGLPYARNAGIRAANGSIVAFTDDDVEVDEGWVAAIAKSFERFPEADCIGGRVLPRWPRNGRPQWLTDRQLAPLALQDKGDVPMRVDRFNAAPCLIGANFSFRKTAFEKAGMFSPDYSRTQDREIQLRLWRAGGVGVYVPDIVTWVDVPEERLTKAYFRLWYTRAGRFHSRMQLLDVLDHEGHMVDAPGPESCLFGAPRYLYRQVLEAAAGCAKAWLSGNEREAFYQENRVRYLGSYIRERWRGNHEQHASAPLVKMPRTASH